MTVGLHPTGANHLGNTERHRAAYPESSGNCRRDTGSSAEASRHNSGRMRGPSAQPPPLPRALAFTISHLKQEVPRMRNGNEGVPVPVGGETMSSTCPGCGAPVEYATRTARVLTAACGACGHGFTIWDQSTPAGVDTGEEGTATSTPGTENPSPVGSTPPPLVQCATCGASITLQVEADGRLQGSCPGCAAQVIYVREGSPGSVPSPPRTSRGEPRRFRSQGPAFSSPTARPCRECGGPLRFSTQPDGTIAGECGSCGNRFSLPARRESYGGRSDRRGAFPRGGSPRFAGRGGWSRSDRGGGPRRFGPSDRRPFRPRERSGSAEEGDEDSNRRRRRNSE